MNSIQTVLSVSRTVLPASLIFMLSLSILSGCGKSSSDSGGSGDDEGDLRLSNPRGSVSADADLIADCQFDGFQAAYTFVADHKGDLAIGDREFDTVTFLPSGAANSSDSILGPAAPGSGIAPGEVGIAGCFTSFGDTRMRIDLYIITDDGVRSNTVGDTFDI